MSELPSDSPGVWQTGPSTPQTPMFCSAIEAAEELRAREDRRACARAQILEMEKYRWCLGVQLGRDPLLDRTRDEICAEWIERHAADFRAWWESHGRHGRE